MTDLGGAGPRLGLHGTEPQPRYISSVRAHCHHRQPERQDHYEGQHTHELHALYLLFLRYTIPPAASLESKPDPVALPDYRTPPRARNQTFAVFAAINSLRPREPGGKSDGKGDREGDIGGGPAAGPVPVRQ